MKLLNTIALSIVLAMALSSCGSGSADGSASTTPTPQSPGGSCPTGYWTSVDMTSSINVGNTGLISLDNKGCLSTGYVNCLSGNDFIMDIQAKSKPEDTININRCQDVGVWKCTYSVSSQVISVFCPETKDGNKYSPAKDFFR